LKFNILNSTFNLVCTEIVDEIALLKYRGLKTPWPWMNNEIYTEYPYNMEEGQASSIVRNFQSCGASF